MTHKWCFTLSSTNQAINRGSCGGIYWLGSLQGFSLFCPGGSSTRGEVPPRWVTNGAASLTYNCTLSREAAPQITSFLLQLIQSTSNCSGLLLYFCYHFSHREQSTVISVIMPPPLISTVNMPPLFLTAVFSFFLGRRCLVEGLVSAPAHHLSPPKSWALLLPKKWQGSQIHLLP